MSDEIIDGPAMPGTDVTRIEGPYKPSALDGAIADTTAVTWLQMIEVAKLMARAGIALPPHARNDPAICWALMLQAREWKLANPFFVAQHSYVVRNQGGVETLAYDSAVFQAVLLASKAIRGRPDYIYEGEGDERRCTVTVVDAQTGQGQVLRTPPLKLCRKHSPLWKDNPDQQLGYYALRNLVRLKYQDVLGGFYDRDEFDGPAAEAPPSPNLMARLPGRIEGEGFEIDTGEQQRQEEAAIAVVREKAEAKAAKDRERKKVYKGAAAARKAEKEAVEAAPEATHDPAPNPADDTANPSG
jgi:hypothetical protein